MSASTDRSQKRSKNFFWIKGEILIRATFQAAITWSVVALPEPKSVKKICEKKTTGTCETTTGTCETSTGTCVWSGFKNLWKICEKSVKIWKKSVGSLACVPLIKKICDFCHRFFWSGHKIVWSGHKIVWSGTKSPQKTTPTWSNSSGQGRFLLLNAGLFGYILLVKPN